MKSQKITDLQIICPHCGLNIRTQNLHSDATHLNYNKAVNRISEDNLLWAHGKLLTSLLRADNNNEFAEWIALSPIEEIVEYCEKLTN